MNQQVPAPIVAASAEYGNGLLEQNPFDYQCTKLHDGERPWSRTGVFVRDVPTSRATSQAASAHADFSCADALTFAGATVVLAHGALALIAGVLVKWATAHSVS